MCPEDAACVITPVYPFINTSSQLFLDVKFNTEAVLFWEVSTTCSWVQLSLLFRNAPKVWCYLPEKPDLCGVPWSRGCVKQCPLSQPPLPPLRASAFPRQHGKTLRVLPVNLIFFPQKYEKDPDIASNPPRIICCPLENGIIHLTFYLVCLPPPSNQI